MAGAGDRTCPKMARKALVSLLLIPVAGQVCPTVTTQPDFDLNRYISKPWWSVQQMAIAYLPPENVFCVSARYRFLPTPNIWGYTLQVHNQAQNVDGSKVQDSQDRICGRSADPRDPAKLEVGLCALPRVPGVTTGPYWVLAYDEMEGYALISGGQPTIWGPRGCRTGTGINDSGLWIFSRSPIRNNTLTQKVRDIAARKGFDLTVLNSVDNSKCENVKLKASNKCFTTPVSDFSIKNFIQARWFVQQQTPPPPFSPQSHCTFLEFSYLSERNLWGYRLQMQSWSVDSDDVVWDTGSSVCAKQSKELPAKLEVGGCLFPTAVSEPLWVLAYNEAEGYALVGGGRGTLESAEGGTCGFGSVAILTRDQRCDQAVVSKVLKIAEDKGFDLSIFHPVDQTKKKCSSLLRY